MTRLKVILQLALVACGSSFLAAFTAPAQAGNIELSIDSNLADYVLETACSGKEVDEGRLRASKTLQAQIKHHSAFSEKYSMDSYIEGLKAASRCETLKDDVFRFRYVVEHKEQMTKAIAFLKSRQQDIVDFVVEKTTPYFPADKHFTGRIVLSAAGQGCGGFSMDGSFFIDVPCVSESIEEEYGAIKVISAHETYHALQYAFFAPFDEDIDRVDTPAEAQNYLFQSLLLEGTAEFVAESRNIPGDGSLATLLSKFAEKGYRRVNQNLRWLGYDTEILGRKGDSNRLIQDVYLRGFSGNNGQEYYCVGATMAKEIEAAFGRDALVCVMALTPEQFVLAYDAAASHDSTEAAPIGAGAVRAAKKLGKRKTSYSTCL